MSEERRYDYLLARVQDVGGYRMEPTPLPDWMHITISDEGDSKWLTVHSRIHLNKAVRMNPAYSKDFSDRDIIKDLSGQITHDFL
jgi:hypothetical protein